MDVWSVVEIYSENALSRAQMTLSRLFLTGQMLVRTRREKSRNPL